MRSAKHKAGGQESVQHRLQSGPMDGTGKCEGVYKLWTGPMAGYTTLK